MAIVKTNPKQKVVKVYKQPTNNEKKENYYAKINLNAMSAAACDLDAGAFKLWVYFAKNQQHYEFALSSTDAANNFGLKRSHGSRLTRPGYRSPTVCPRRIAAKITQPSGAWHRTWNGPAYDP